MVQDHNDIRAVPPETMWNAQRLRNHCAHVLLVQDLDDALKVAIVELGRSLLQCPFCRDIVSYPKFCEHPQFIEAINAGLIHCIGKLDYHWNPDPRKFKDAQ